jgi:hypothetical protein
MIKKDDTPIIVIAINGIVLCFVLGIFCVPIANIIGNPIAPKPAIVHRIVLPILAVFKS